MSPFTALLAAPEPIATLRRHLGEFDDELARLFTETRQAAPLIRAKSAFLDEMLAAIWRHHIPSGTRDALTLIAVGGYGRGEMHPASDVDLLLLTPTIPDEATAGDIGRFFQFLWDIGLRIGQSVRTLNECVDEARRDQTVLTSLLEARWLIGDTEPFEALRATVLVPDVWPPLEFLAAKLDEARIRHARSHHSAYNLEPNIKDGPGGLRDLHMLGWVANRLYGARDLQQLVAMRLLTDREYAELETARDFLWSQRFALHTLTRRAEERLLFEHQRELSHHIGHGEGNEAVEAYMQQYFRTVKGVERLTEMLLQLFGEHLRPPTGEPRPINARFHAVGGHLAASQTDVFQRHPAALLEVFLLLQRDATLVGVAAPTIRLIHQALPLLDDTRRHDPETTQLFMDLLRQPGGITHQLRRMNRYGVLAAYLPEFERVVGRMQFDLFHAYTVDEHTLFVVRNLRRMALAEYQHELPLCHDVFSLIARPELLYVAGLLHDIAKGSGGDHSRVGEKIAKAFCLHHRLSAGDTRLVCWLVRNHLLMSLTAQRKDIADPGVVHDFAATVGSEEYLHHIYLLTVADIRATNHNLWNSWKDALLRELYHATLRAFRRGVHNPPAEAERIDATQRDARAILLRLGLPNAAIPAIWRRFDDDYFLRYAAAEIAWHTAALARVPTSEPLVLLAPEGLRGSAEVHLFAPASDALFARATAQLDQLGLTIVHARIIRTRDGSALHSYQILEHDGASVTGLRRQSEIIQRLQHAIQNPTTPIPRVSRREAAQKRQFSVPTEILFHDEPQGRYALLELLATDRPGLLSIVGEVFSQLGVRVHHAQISTIGSRAEDLFHITDRENRPIPGQETRAALRAALTQALGAELAS